MEKKIKKILNDVHGKEPKKYTTINVSSELALKLTMFKYEHKFKTINEVILFLMNNQK